MDRLGARGNARCVTSPLSWQQRTSRQPHSSTAAAAAAVPNQSSSHSWQWQEREKTGVVVGQSMDAPQLTIKQEVDSVSESDGHSDLSNSQDDMVQIISSNVHLHCQMHQPQQDCPNLSPLTVSVEQGARWLSPRAHHQHPHILAPDEAAPLPTVIDLTDVGVKEEPCSEESSNTLPRNSATSIDFSRSTKLKKKGAGMAGKSIEEELCLICGDKASGYHYNALSCEGCKGFFRRSVTRGASYSCKYGGHCEMDMWMRRKCQACRLRRCCQMGMKEECLLSEDQCKARDVRRKARMRSHRLQDSVDVDSQPSPDSNTVEPKLPSVHAVSPLPLPTDTSQLEQPLDCVSEQSRHLIEKLVLYQDKYELPSEEDVKKLQSVELHQPSAESTDEFANFMWKKMAEMTILVTQLVVEFAKNMPGFTLLAKEDQITLLKSSASEVMMLRTARRYDIETDTVVFADGNAMTKDTLRFAGLGGLVDNMFNFCKNMSLAEVDNAEYALLTAISILSERPGLKEAKQVEQLQESYITTLQSYIKYRRPLMRTHFAKLIMKLTDLRSLSAEHSDVLLSLKLKKGSLPPLLEEYFDVMD